MRIQILSAILKPEEEVIDQTEPIKPKSLRTWHQYWIKGFLEQGDTVTALNFLRHGVNISKDYDFLLLLSGGTNFRKLPQIREKKIPTMILFKDSWEHYERDLNYKSLFYRSQSDVALIKCYPTLGWYRKDNIPAVWFPESIDPDYFFPMNLKRENDLFFSGRGRTKRTNYLRKLEENFKCDFHVFLSPYSKRWPPFTPQIESKIAGFKEYRIGMNKAKLGFECTKAGDMGPRTFEILACKTCAIVERMKGAEKLFEEDKEIVFWEDWTELYRKIKYYLENEKERKKIAEAGYKKVREKHTVQNRINYLKRLYRTIIEED